MSHQYLAYQLLVYPASPICGGDTYSDQEAGLDLNQHLNDGCITPSELSNIEELSIEQDPAQDALQNATRQ